MTKIVFNSCIGAFGLSEAAWQRYVALGGNAANQSAIERTDPFLIQVVEELGKDANGPSADLLVAEIPTGVKYRIDETDGDGREAICTIFDNKR
jgi:hypothetical protein